MSALQVFTLVASLYLQDFFPRTSFLVTNKCSLIIASLDIREIYHFDVFVARIVYSIYNKLEIMLEGYFFNLIFYHNILSL